MPPPLALALTLLFTAYLFGRDWSQQYQSSRALWIPSVYLLIIGSRSVTEWLTPGTSAGNYEEGSNLLDVTVNLFLVVAGLVVILRRQILWSRVIRKNLWVILYFLYCGVSIFWSDFPSIALRRWMKAFGDPIMALVILTDGDPIRAIETVLKTCTYVLIPLSVLFIKYYPHLGRVYDGWTGAIMNTGVTTNKNQLGFVCMICGLFLVWRLFGQWKRDRQSSKSIDIGISILLLFMIGWLLHMANSLTSLVALCFGVFVFIGLGFRSVKEHIGSYVVVGLLLFSALQFSFNITDILATELGRDPTLTGRITIWEKVTQVDINPWIGTGYESLWIGQRFETINSAANLKNLYSKLNMAHSGYIETYVNVGWIGLFFLGAMILSCYTKMRELLNSHSVMTESDQFGRFGMTFLLAYLLYNYSEAGFKTLHFLFVIFLFFTLSFLKPQQRVSQLSPASLSTRFSRNLRLSR